MFKFIAGIIIGIAIWSTASWLWGANYDCSDYCHRYSKVKVVEKIIEKECEECECLCEPIYITDCDRTEVEACYIDLQQQTDLLSNCKIDLVGKENEIKNLIQNLKACLGTAEPEYGIYY